MTTPSRPRLVSLEIRGFRAFGTEARVLHLDAPLVVVQASNSQGKTSLAEAIEFLISGRSSRRELLGGAKAEYNDSLRNAHLPATDTDVYVAAMVRDTAGDTHQVRRELVCDFGQGTECDSRLLVDGVEVTDLDHLGLPLADPPVRAPVLLQHILRHVLSTEPKQRVDYFKALLELTDLDLLRDRVKAARVRVDSASRGATLQLVDALIDTPAAPAVATITALTKKPLTSDAARDAITTALLGAGTTMLTAAHAVDPDHSDVDQGTGGGFATLDSLGEAIDAALNAQRESIFPLTAFAATALPAPSPSSPDLAVYRTALAAADQHSARIAPVLEAVLNVDEYADLEHPVPCPVCGTDDALTPERIALLLEHIQTTTALGEAARSVASALGDARHVLDQFAASAAQVAPPAARWTEEQLNLATDAIRDLGLDADLLNTVLEHAVPITAAVTTVTAAIATARRDVEEFSDAVASRQPLPSDLDDHYSEMRAAAERLTELVTQYDTHAGNLRTAVETATRDRITIKGLHEIAEILTLRNELIADVVAEAARQRQLKRINAADKAVREATTAVLDTRFAQMSDTITDWWSTVRPEELVGFGGNDVDDEASTLGDLVPLVSGYAIDNAERGRWRSFPKLLNSGNHDDEVPSTIGLKQIRGNLRTIAKTQRERWPKGLLL